MKYIYLMLCLVLGTTAFAQVNQNRCGTFDLMKFKEEQTPGYMARVNACFDNAKQIANAARTNRSVNDTIYHVRLVFHVVYTDSTEDVPDSVIYSQVDVLNEDYRRRNADTVKTRDMFKDVAADAGIEFSLATLDPQGNPTTGITHDLGSPQGLLGFTTFGDEVKSLATGGVDPWPTDKYVNIWVCNIMLGIGVLGYSYPPDNAPNWPANSTTDSAKQGVVLHYPVVGRNYAFPIDPSVTKGRSCTHELGHYFGLRHIWGDGDCSVDDGLDDTPDANGAHQQTCDTTSNTCPDSPTDFPDMIENYMDYSDDHCLNMFTKEQVGIMRAMLQTSRAGVATIETATHINEADKNFESVAVYPNPTTNVVNVTVQVKGGKEYGYEVYNEIGEKIKFESSLSSFSNHKVIDLSAQASGLYFIRFTSGEQTIVKKVQVLR